MEIEQKLYERREKLDVIAKALDNQKKRLDIKEAKQDYHRNEVKLTLDVLDNLRQILRDRVVDDETTIFSSEPKYKKVFNDDEIDFVKKKIMKIVSKI